MRRSDIDPKVFISHASEDKERFLRAFATKLRQEAGVDAWVDEWEIYPGDSLVQKIFEEGLKDAEAIIIVLSERSVDKPWVREELDASIIKKVEDLTTLIPVVIDDCEVPESLRSTVWQRIENLEEYGTEFDRIVAAIYGHRGDKLELGPPPEYSPDRCRYAPRSYLSGHPGAETLLPKGYRRLRLLHTDPRCVGASGRCRRALSGVQRQLGGASRTGLHQDG